jgi:MoxR-like ATPase
MSSYYSTPSVDAVRNFVKHSDHECFIIAEGASGSGKTFLSEVIAKELKAKYLYHLMTRWDDTESLFNSVNITGVVSGDAVKAIVPGCIRQAVELSLHTKVVLCMDELDKSTDDVENALLGFLQSGIIPLHDRTVMQANMSNLVIIFTSNGTRQLSDPFIRRCRRVFFKPIPTKIIKDILHGQERWTRDIISFAVSALSDVANASERRITVQECTKFLNEVYSAPKKDENLVREALISWGASNENGVDAASKHKLIPPLVKLLAKI